VERVLTVDDLERLAIGAGILGTGGGGNPYLGKLHALQHLKAGARIQIVDPDDVPDDAVVTCLAGMGAPTVSIERLPQGDEELLALRAMERYTGQRVAYILPGDIRGANSITPMIVAAQTGLPVIDADGMGRAFPELQMDTFSIAGVPSVPAVLASYSGHTVIFDHIDDAEAVERYARVVTIQMGGGAGLAMPVLTGAQAKASAVPRTVSLAIAIGDAVLRARAQHADPVDAACRVAGGRRLFEGKIVDVQRRNAGGFARGVLHLEGTGAFARHSIRIDFQNENLIARDELGARLATVPDLICVVDQDTGEPITTEIVRYGLRVAVLGIPAPAQLRTPAALAVVGPAAFGYPDVGYVPLDGVYGGALLPAG
jgi:DUF917 family protein